ncbi:TrbI/VirB10 family protein [Paraburkholderia sp. MM5384-R2]|uniref:TrbI/VirB10 family protein n=1 Tax=Paraburkholderia sp. MM5384-R2 TaxID=2723097 RepID=UPI00160929FC|nr:TrbI/VirB10 family protein [Paraburkholderia sp. MM5384-R2]MBB5498758.1 type IV secretion system protein VirB10 [Paraburkholderia sp. MM5384-R2]
MNTPDNPNDRPHDSGPPGGEPGGAGDSLSERRRAADALRQTSLAADPALARRQTFFTVAGVILFLLCAGGFYAMKHDAPAPSGSSDKPKIDEDTTKAAPLDAGRQKLPASMAAAASAPAASSGVDPDEARRAAERQRQAAAAAEQARRKAEAMREARMKSGLFGSDTGGDGSDDAGAASADAQQGEAGLGRRSGGDGPNDPNSAFARSVANADDSTVKAQKIENLQCRMEPGAILEGHLLPRIISDLPGSITIMLDRDAFGEKGRIPLLPWGTRITGKPNSSVRKGQERTFIASAVALRPDGVKIRVDSPVADQLGSAGIDADVDNHVGQILGMSAALAILGAGASNYGVSSSDRNNSSSMYRENVQSSMAQSSQQLLGGYVNIPPTLKNDQGTRVRIQVEHELDFSDYCKPGSEED